MRTHRSTDRPRLGRPLAVLCLVILSIFALNFRVKRRFAVRGIELLSPCERAFPLALTLGLLATAGGFRFRFLALGGGSDFRFALLI